VAQPLIGPVFAFNLIYRALMPINPVRSLICRNYASLNVTDKSDPESLSLFTIFNSSFASKARSWGCSGFDLKLERLAACRGWWLASL